MRSQFRRCSGEADAVGSRSKRRRTQSLRTVLEDRTLQAELPGYPEYAQRVRYRLLPGIW